MGREHCYDSGPEGQAAHVQRNRQVSLVFLSTAKILAFIVSWLLGISAVKLIKNADNSCAFGE